MRYILISTTAIRLYSISFMKTCSSLCNFSALAYNCEEVSGRLPQSVAARWREVDTTATTEMTRDNQEPKARDGMAVLMKIYLFTYNLIQFLGFVWIFSNITARLLLEGKDSIYHTFKFCWTMMFICQILTVVEVINPALGLVNTAIFPALVQVMGRNVILFVIFGSLGEMQNRAVVFFVFYLWSAIEIFRYPFYMLACIGLEWRILTWLRYTVWALLYPLGTVAEAVAVVQSLSLFDESGLYSIPLPAALGQSISFSFTLKLYLFVMFLGLFINMRHLISQRRCHLLRRDLKVD